MSSRSTQKWLALQEKRHKFLSDKDENFCRKTETGECSTKGNITRKQKLIWKEANEKRSACCYMPRNISGLVCYSVIFFYQQINSLACSNTHGRSSVTIFLQTTSSDRNQVFNIGKILSET